ncbi:hypothetical protein AAE478_002875 [Parahypoxylon ruwenzoriense]
MAPKQDSKVAEATKGQMTPTSAVKTGRVSRWANASPQRSSLRLAIQASLRDRRAMAAVATPPPTARPSPVSTPGTPALSLMSAPIATPTASSPGSSIGQQPARQQATGPETQRNGVATPARQNGGNWNLPSRNRASALPNGWYAVSEIVGETRKAGRALYLVDWEGVDPRTGEQWPNSWVEAKDVSPEAIRAWEDDKKEMEAARRQSR